MKIIIAKFYFLISYNKIKIIKVRPSKIIHSTNYNSNAH